MSGRGIIRNVRGGLGGGDDFLAVLGFGVFYVAGFVVDDAELAGIAVAIDAVDFSIYEEAIGVEGDFSFDVKDFPAIGEVLSLFDGEPIEALFDGLDLDADGEWRMGAELAADAAVEFGLVIGGEFFGGGE